MKKFIKFLFLIILASALSVDAMSMQNQKPNNNNHNNQWNNRNNNDYRNGSGPKGSVGAPLDGGLLAVLGAAGIAYVAARKKKKNSQV